MHSQKRHQSQPGTKLSQKDHQSVNSAQAHLASQSSELPMQLVKQFNKGVLKKSDLLLLQRFESTIQRNKTAQNVIIYDVPGSKDHQDSKMPNGFVSQANHRSGSLQGHAVQSSLKHGKTKSVGVLNPAHITGSGSQPNLNIYVKSNAVNSGQIPAKESTTSLTQRNSSARGVKFNFEPSAQLPQTYLVGSNSHNSLHQKQTGYQEASSNYQKNISVMQQSAYDKPLPGFSASNGYLTQVHSPTKNVIKGSNGKSTPEMHPINLGVKQMISSKHPQKKQASVYTNSHVNTSMLSNSQHIADISQTTFNQNSMLVDEHQTAFDYQFHSRPSSLDKKVQVQNPAMQQQLRRQIEVNNFLMGQMQSDSPQKLDSLVQMHVAQQKALLPGVKIKSKAQEEMMLQRPKHINEIKRGDVTPPQSSEQRGSTHYSNNLINQSQFGGSKQTRTNIDGKSVSGHNQSIQGTNNSINQRSARGENLNVSQDAIKMAANQGKQPKSSLLLADSQKKIKQESVNSQKLPQKFIINSAIQVSNSNGKQAQIQNIILQQTKRQKSKTNVNSLQNSIVHQGSSQASLKSSVIENVMHNAKIQLKEPLLYNDTFQKHTGKDALHYEPQKRHSVKTTQNSPRTLNLNQAAINRNYYKQQISAPGSDKYHSSSNLLNGSYSELHNLPNDLNRSSKRSLQVDDRSKPQLPSTRKMQANPSQPYEPVQRKDYFSMGPAQVNSLQASGSKTPSRLIDNHLVYQYQDLSTIQVEHSDQIIRDKRLSLNVNADRKINDQQSPNIPADQYLVLLQRNNSRISSNDESSTDQHNRKHLNPILDGGTGTSNNLMQQNDSQTDFHRQIRAKGGKYQMSIQQVVQAGKQSKTPNLKQEQMIYLGQPGSILQNAESVKLLSKQPSVKKKSYSPGLNTGKKMDPQFGVKHASIEKSSLKIMPAKETFQSQQYRPID